jgi:uncharacterized protein YecE (DUF72 family)
MEVRIGTAGHSYRDWVGGFYPPGTRSGDMLPFYAGQFSIVEINSSFYRPPTRAQIARMVDRTPPEFAFTLKIPKSVSHGRTSDDLAAFRMAVEPMAQAGRLHGLLLQTPQSFHNTASNHTWLEHVGQQLRPYHVSVEFRHRSWADPNLIDWLEHVGLDVVSVAVPDLPSLFPSGVRIANRRIYARFHSGNAANWYAGGKPRYEYDFSEEELGVWASQLKMAANAGQAGECLIFFNNCVTTRAIENAHLLASLLKRSEPAVRVIEPRASPRERSLFDE